MYLRRILTRNLQNHKEVVIDLPPTGLVVFTGDNSNGKSVIVRALLAILSGKIGKPRTRAALVNRQSTFAELEFVRSDDTILLAHISRTANLTYLSYTEAGKEPIIRYSSDKSFKELCNRFGWHYDKDLGLTLNIAQAEDPLLFYKTPYKANGTILRSATSDSAADKVVEEVTRTLKESKTYRDRWVTEVTTINTTLSGLTVEPIEPLQEKKEKLEWCLRNLEHIKFPVIPEVKPVPTVSPVSIRYPDIPKVIPVPKVKFIQMVYPVIPTVKYPRIIQCYIDIPDITKVALDIQELLEHRCPTCGRRFIDENS